MSRFLQKLIDVVTIDDRHAAFIKKGISGSLLLEVFARVVLFAVTILLTHHLTGEDYGRYSYYMGVVISLATIATFGLDDLVIKQMGGADQRDAYSLNRPSLLFAIFVGALLGWSFYLISPSVPGLGYISGTIALMTLQFMMSAYLKGKKHVISAQVPEQLIRTSGFFVLVLLQFFYFEDFSFEGIARAVFISAVVSSLVSIGLLIRKENVISIFSSPSWRSIFSGELLLFAALSLFGVFRHKLDVILLGWYELFVETGVYNICSKLSDLLLVGLMITNVVYMPLFASQKEYAQSADLSKILKSSATLNMIIGGGLLILFILFGHQILGFFGEGYDDGYAALIILSISTFIYAVLGPYIIMLMMVGYAKDVLVGLVMGVGVQFILALILIEQGPVYGMAIAKGISILLIQFYMMWTAWRRLRIKPFFFN